VFGRGGRPPKLRKKGYVRTLERRGGAKAEELALPVGRKEGRGNIKSRQGPGRGAGVKGLFSKKGGKIGLRKKGKNAG